MPRVPLQGASSWSEHTGRPSVPEGTVDHLRTRFGPALAGARPRRALWPVRGKVLQAIVLAGGKATRLRPLTRRRPKALMRIGNHTVLELILARLKAGGFSRVTLCVSHMRDMIIDEFGSGRELGLSIDYCVDAEPLGTAGPLKHVPAWNGPALTMNADVLTELDLAAVYQAHQRKNAVITVACQRREVAVDQGVLEIWGDGQVVGFREKPRYPVDISAGIYVVSPEVRNYLVPDKPTDMSDLITEMIADDQPVFAFPFDEAWYDIGTPSNLEAARQHFADVYRRNNHRVATSWTDTDLSSARSEGLRPRVESADGGDVHRTPEYGPS